MDIIIHIGTFEYKTNVKGGSMTSIPQEIEDLFGISRGCISDITF